jgi:hypothetical protein
MSRASGAGPGLLLSVPMRNALFAAIGVRVRTLPLTDKNILQAIG